MTETKEVTIRPYRDGDAAAFVALNREWIESFFRVEEEDEKVFRDPEGVLLRTGGRIVFAEEDGVAVGTCALLPVEEGTFELAKMAVRPSHQGRGIGRALMAAMLLEAREMGARRLVLQTNSRLESAIHLYEAFGFRRVAMEMGHAAYSRADVTMELELGRELE